MLTSLHIHKTASILGVEVHICTDAESGPQRRQLSSVDNQRETSPCGSRRGIQTRDNNCPEQVCVTCERVQVIPVWVSTRLAGIRRKRALRSGPSEMFTQAMCEITKKTGSRVDPGDYQKTRGEAGERRERWPSLLPLRSSTKFTPKTVPHQGADLRG